MSCCGKKRTEFHGTTETHQYPKNSESAYSHQRLGSSSAVYFEYVGKTGLIVHGPVSGRNYRFSGPGAIVEIDPGDIPSIAVVPNLRQVRDN